MRLKYKSRIKHVSCGEHRHRNSVTEIDDRHLSIGSLRKLCKWRKLTIAVHAVNYVLENGRQVPMDILTGLLQRSFHENDLVVGRQLYVLIIENGFFWNVKLGCLLIRMFSSCESLLEAVQVFESLHEQNVYAWTAIITAHVWHGQDKEAVLLYKNMLFSGVNPSSYTFVAVLKGSTNLCALNEGKLIHADITKLGFELDRFVGSALVDMYAKCGSIDNAEKVFDALLVRDIVSWSSMISGYTHHRLAWKALQLFDRMQQEGMEPNQVTFVYILKACGIIEDLDRGKLIHANVVKQGLQSDIYIQSALVDMYAKCSSLKNALMIFNELSIQDMVSWSVLITAYADCGQNEEALQLFKKMQADGIEADETLFVCILKLCSNMDALHQGKMIHAAIVTQGLESSLFIGTTFIEMYSKWGTLGDACRVFDKFIKRDVVLWSALIAAYVEHGHGKETLGMLEKMREEGTEPDRITFVLILKACASTMAIECGRQIHADIVKQGIALDAFARNMLLDMYAKCGKLGEAFEVFSKLPIQDVISWNAMISGHARLGHGQEALQLFEKMKQEGKEADDVTFVWILKSCSSIAALEQGRLIHCDILKRGLESVLFLESTVIDMYAKCNSLADAQEIFGKLQAHDMVSWNAMISAYAEHGLGHEALETFKNMKEQGTEANIVTSICVLKACCTLASPHEGMLIHANIESQGFDIDHIVGSILVDMYCKCGNLDDAHKVFEILPMRDVVSWNAIIAGCGEHGYCKLARKHFETMQQEGVRPDMVTFVCVLSACGRTGLVQEGHHYFECMKEQHFLTPTIEHYICIIDTLGRAGLLDEALHVVLKMPFQPNHKTWFTLLSSCAKYDDIALARQIFDCLVNSDYRDGAGYVLMSNMYSANYMWEDAHNVREMGVVKKAWKIPGKIWIAEESDMGIYGQ